MTNTKFRRRVLLSSVAMLLVALVALGSATFAWFTDDPKADATGIKVTANTGLGLVAKTTTNPVYGHHPLLFNGKVNNVAWSDFVLIPATTADGATFYTASAAQESGPAIKTGQSWTTVPSALVDPSAALVSGVYHEQITLKTTEGSPASDIKLKKVYMVPGATTHNMNNAVVVLVKWTDNASTPATHIKEYSLTQTSISKWKAGTLTGGTTATADGTAATSIAAAATYNSSTQTFGDGSDTQNEVIASSVAAGTECTVDVYVYLNGDHTNVYTDNATNLPELISKIKFDFEAETPTT